MLFDVATKRVVFGGAFFSCWHVIAASRSLSSGNAFSDELESWNDAMDAFKICQPCVAYDTLGNSNKKNIYNANGDRYGSSDNNSNDDEDNEQEGGDEEDAFVCRNNLERDEPVNQCQVFVEEGEDTMSVATYSDILRK